MQPTISVDLAIDPATVRMFIEKAKSAAADIPSLADNQAGDSVEFDAERLEDTHHHDGLAEEESENMSGEELRELIDDLNSDEAATLVAIAWVGRGDFEGNDYASAFDSAVERAEGATSTYLMGMPMLAANLEAGLDALGV